ncbi:hypothetical protein CREGCYN_06520 [Synechococcus sp. M16CYN]
MATLNLAWVTVDLSYIPLRNFWLQRNLHPESSISFMVPLPWLSDITLVLDSLKGIEPHRETQTYLDGFERLDKALQTDSTFSSAITIALLRQQQDLTGDLVSPRPFASFSNTRALDELRNRLRIRTGLDSAKDAAEALLSTRHLKQNNWMQERQFWNQQILPLVEINYWRSIDEKGQPTDLSWRVDTPFQLLFLLDIVIRCLRWKRRHPTLHWRDALLRRWIDLPMLLPFARWLRVIPVTERLSNAGLIQLEPIRAVISRGVVTLLAVELFEVITLYVVDALQQLIRSPQLSEQVRRIRVHQNNDRNGNHKLVELMRLWLPLLLTKVGPALRPQLVALISHMLHRSLGRGVMPKPLRRVGEPQTAEAQLSRQLAISVVDSVLDLSRGAGNRIGQRDQVLEDLGTDVLDRLWEELATILDQGTVLERSQDLLISFLEDFKHYGFHRLRNQDDINTLIDEVNGSNLGFYSRKTSKPSLKN